jgi:hypothetical protein
MASASGTFFEPRSGSRASFVDLIGNAVLISGLDIDDAPAMLLPGRYPLKCMPSLIHEADHFDAFRMPVGSALAIVYLRAWSRAAKALDGHGADEEADLYESVVDLLRYRTVTAALAPLLEGLALYAEFDAFPGNSPVTRTSTILSSLLFGKDPREAPEDVTVAHLARENLLLARELDVFTARKENLISQPFSIRGGGYLPGYYIVKNIFHFMMKYKKAFDLMDGDLFLWVLHLAIMGDLELARLILDPELDLMFSAEPHVLGRDAVNAPLIRIQSRLTFLLKDLTLEKIKEVERIISGKGWRWDSVQLDTTQEQSAKALALMLSEVEKLTHVSQPTSAISRHVANVCHRVLSTRDLLCLASFEADIEITKDGRCRIASTNIGGFEVPRLTIPALPTVVAGRGHGTYEVYFQRDASRVFYVVSRDRVVVATATMGEDESFDPELIKDLKPSVRAHSQLKDSMESDIDRAIIQDPTWRGIIAHYDTQTEGLMDQIYANYVGAFLEDEHKGRLSTSLIERGLLSFPPQHLSFLSTFAQVACRCGNFAIPEILEQECRAINVPVEAFTAGLASWRGATEFPLVSNVGDLTAFLL